MSSIRFAAPAIVLVSGLALAIPAQAQGRLEARYSITMTGVPIGKAALTADIGGAQYAVAASGRASGLFSVLVNGEGSVTARGAVRNGKSVPTNFVSSITREDEKAELEMRIDDGTVKELTAETGKPAPDRVPLTTAHRQGIVDPLSALLIPIASAYDVASAEACQRTLPVFDGRRRYDLKLTFKRMDQVKAEKGYAGPVAVCAVTFQPQAGHRASSALVKHLAEGRDIELWLAPVAGTRMLAPFRASVASMIGNLVVQATRFETSPQTAAALP